jgi:N-acetylglutamate synthase-like GNAT family acetyltransferase
MPESADTPSGFHLRSAIATDQAAIRALIRQVRINPMGLHWPRFVVAVDAQGRLVGCGQIKTHRDGCRELASVAVAPDHREQGIATCILHELLRGRDPPLYLICRESLAPWYRRFGFHLLEREAEMPPRYRCLHRAASWLVRLRPGGEGMAIMSWCPPAQAAPARLM